MLFDLEVSAVYAADVFLSIFKRVISFYSVIIINILKGFLRRSLVLKFFQFLTHICNYPSALVIQIIFIQSPENVFLILCCK